MYLSIAYGYISSKISDETFDRLISRSVKRLVISLALAEIHYLKPRAWL
jgi:hypothetical protein